MLNIVLFKKAHETLIQVETDHELREKDFINDKQLT